jgi:hypothetical protein
MRSHIAIVAVLALAACGSKGGKGPSLPACPATDEVLSVSPLEDADVRELSPLGNLNPPGHVFPTEHQYLYLPLGTGGAAAVVPVVSPGALVLVDVASSEHLSASPSYLDYDLTLAACDGLSFKLGHVATLDAGLAARIGGATGGACQQYDTGGQTYRRCQRSVSAALAPGQPIGTAGGNPGQWALDLGAHDTRKPPVALVRPGAYGEAAYARCILDYATASVRAALLGKVVRTVEPRCGSQAQDLDGTAQGNWRRAGRDTYPEDPHLALVHDMLDPTRTALSIGTSLAPLAPMVASPATASSGRANRSPSAVVPDGGTWCWDVQGARLVVQLVSAASLRAEGQAGACGGGPWTLGAGAVEFTR